RLARARTGGLSSPDEYRHALRDAARACLYGVDRNPFAVELAVVALWIETVDPGKPLGFLDANIRCGDSLLGLYDLAALAEGVPDAAYKPLTGDDKPTAKYFSQRNRDERKGQADLLHGGRKLPAAAKLAAALLAMRALPEDSPDEIAAKRERWKELQSGPLTHARGEAADLYIASFLLPKTGGPPALGREPMVPTTGDVWRALAGRQGHPPMVARAVDASRAERAFHWPLEFPDIFLRGKFDVVLGNPPWEVMQLGEEEYFAQRLPDIAGLAGATRKRAIAELATERPSIFAEYEADKRLFEASAEFARSSGRFDRTAKGKINTYALFAELFSMLASPRGRAGVIVPTGIATDATTAPFFAALIEGKRLFALHDFQTGMGFFDRIGHARFKFCLLTVGARQTGPERPSFSFFARTEEDFRDHRRHFS
ncbi:MAG: Eco57I restriction-modification methylase domain-containing protein, partial [Acetobacteraceae bacterium]